MVMIDLNKGDHSHPAVIGGVSYYETCQTPQYYNYGRHPQQDFNINKVIFRPAGDNFPFTNGIVQLPVRDGLVHTVQTPTSLFLYRDQVTNDTAVTSKFHIDSYSISGIYTNLGGTVTVSNVRMLSRDGTVQSISLPFSGDAYTNKAILFDVQMTGQILSTQPQIRWAGGPGVTGTDVDPLVSSHHIYDIWHYCQWQPYAGLLNTSSTNKTRVEISPDGDIYTILTFDAYGTFDSTLSRQVVLTKEGILMIVDNVTPGTTANGMSVGSLWQIYTPSADSGTNWYAEAGEYAFQKLEDPSQTSSMGHVVKFFTNTNTASIGLAQIPDARGNNADVIQSSTDRTQNIAYVKSTAVAGVRVNFTTVVVPTPAEGTADFTSIAGNITKGSPDDGYADVTIHKDSTNPYTTGDVRIKTSPYGGWSITRY